MLNSWEIVVVELKDRQLLQLWPPINGFSAAGAWLEYYKQLIVCGIKGTWYYRMEYFKEENNKLQSSVSNQLP